MLGPAAIDRHESVLGSYRPPALALFGPQTSISFPVQTAACCFIGGGTLDPVEVGVHVSSIGS
jgi:hypothetical protein